MFDISPMLSQPFSTFATAKNIKMKGNGDTIEIKNPRTGKEEEGVISEYKPMSGWGYISYKVTFPDGSSVKTSDKDNPLIRI